MIVGRSVEGVLFTAESAEPARLIFLLVTPMEQHNDQVFLLAQLAAVAGSEVIRERLCRAQSRQELAEIIAAADPEGRKGTQASEENDQAQCEDRWRDDGGQGGLDEE